MTQRVNFIIGIFLLYWMIKGLNLVYLILMDKINSKNTNKNNNNNSKKSIGYSEENKIIQYYKRKSKINKVTNFYPNVISSIGFSILKIFNIEENYNKYIFFVNDKYLKYIYEDYLIYKKENNLNYFYVSLRLFTNNENRIYALIVYFDMFEKYIDEQVNYLINNKYEYNSRNKHKNKDIDILHLKGYYTKVVINRFWTGSGIRKEDFMENLGEDYRNKCYVYEVDNIDVSRTGIVFYMDTVYFNIFLIGGNIGYLLKENYIFLEKCEHLAMKFNSRVDMKTGVASVNVDFSDSSIYGKERTEWKRSEDSSVTLSKNLKDESIYSTRLTMKDGEFKILSGLKQDNFSSKNAYNQFAKALGNSNEGAESSDIFIVAKALFPSKKETVIIKKKPVLNF